MSKPIYLRMFVEIRAQGALKPDQKVWSRKFPNFKSQIEWIREDTLYWRGSGGGFPMRVKRKDLDYVYLWKRTAGGEENYRIARSDYDQLERKAEHAGQA